MADIIVSTDGKQDVVVPQALPGTDVVVGGAFRGEKGDTGAAGLIGLTGPTGATGATGAKGDKGDKGDTGATGSNGLDGTMIYTGSVAPTTTYHDGDLYFNSANGNLYKQSGGAWGSPIDNLVGPVGATGASGATGATGPKGDTGATGPQGIKGDTGAQGVQGLQGNTGPAGPAGAPGADGVVQSVVAGINVTVDSTDPTNPIVNSTASGDVVGPASSTDNAIARFDTTTGKLIQNSNASIDDSGNLTATNFSGNSSGTNTGDQTTITGNAGTATALQTARTFRTNLASTATASFNGTANVTPGVTGTLPVANGGTGATSAAAARTALGVPNITVSTITPSSPSTGDLWVDTN
jgi:hypothetical protein